MKGFRWPAGVKCAVFLSVQFDAESFDLKHTTEDRLFGRFSYGRYGVRAGLPRLLAMFQRRQVAATFFVNGYDATRHRDEVREIHDAGHEIAARGWDMAPLPTLGEQEADAIVRGRDVLAGICGKAPRGFRAPSGELSSRTLRLLAENGFRYDSTFQDDDHPYVIAPSAGSKLVEIPTSWALDDSLVLSARHTNARLMKIWREEFDALAGEGCLVPFTIHVRGDVGLTRAARIAALEELLTSIAAQPGVKFMTGEEIASYTLECGLQPEPDPIVQHRETLAVTPYRGDLAVKPL